MDLSSLGRGIVALGVIVLLIGAALALSPAEVVLAEVDAAIEKLRQAGLKPSTSMTLRDIADTGNRERLALDVDAHLARVNAGLLAVGGGKRADASSS